MGLKVRFSPQLFTGVNCSARDVQMCTILRLQCSVPKSLWSVKWLVLQIKTPRTVVRGVVVYLPSGTINGNAERFARSCSRKRLASGVATR